MPDDLFDDVACFRDGLSISQRGKLAGYLTRACQAVPAAVPAAALLGDITNPTRRDQARQHLNAMGSIPRRQVLAGYQKLTRSMKD